MPKRFPKQQVIYHPPGTLPPPEVHKECRKGRAITITAECLAMVEYITEQLGSDEGIWFYGSDRDDPQEILRHVIVPKQTVSPGFCQTEDGEALAAGRLARQNGWVIRATGHGHGRMGVFSSKTDLGEMRENARQGIAVKAQTIESSSGRVRELPSETPST